MSEPLLICKDICLDHGQIRALNKINFEIGSGEIHALVGENGAGKTSLAGLISGFYKPQSGKIRFCGKEYDGFSLLKARSLGIEMIHQEIRLTEQFTVADNLFIPSRSNILIHRIKEILNKARTLLAG